MERKELTTKYVQFILEEGILIVVYGKDLEITLDVAKYVVGKRLLFTEGRNYPALADITKNASTNKEAREYLSSDAGMKGVLAGALQVDSAFSTIIGNFFLKIAYNKPTPTRLFSDWTSALKWLEQFKEE